MVDPNVRSWYDSRTERTGRAAWVGARCADGTLVNSRSAKQSLRVTIGFVDKDGGLRGEAVTTLPDVEPGRTAHWSVTGFGALAPVACQIAAPATSQPTFPPPQVPTQPAVPAS